MVIPDIRPIEPARNACHNPPVPDPRTTVARRVPSTSRRRSRGGGRVAVVAGLMLVAAGCGTSTPPSGSAASSAASASAAPTSGATASAVGSPAATATPLSSAALADLYRTIEDQVIQIRGLQPKHAVDPTVLDDAGIKKLTSGSFDRDNPPAVVAADQRMYQALGMLPADASLRDLYLELLGSQVAGLYSPTDKHLYVVARSGGIGPAEKVTFAHEFTHALQDQNFDLGSLKLDEIGHGDQSLGRLSLVEGDATLTMSKWQTEHLTAAESGEIIAESANDPSLAQLLAMPPILRESLLFPYFQGLGFVQGLQANGGWAAVNAAFVNPPLSTEQIIHPDKYAATEPPLAVTLPTDLPTRLGTGWTSALEDTFGEFQFQVWLRQNTTIGANGATEAAAGWGGDRIEVLDGPSGTWGLVLRTAWDTTTDAQQFEAAATPIVEALTSPGHVLPGRGGTERWVVIASDDSTLSKVAGAVGLAG
jgi:hypothetical protein